MGITSTVRVKRTNPGWLARLLKEYKQQQVLAIGYPTNTKGTSTMYPNGTSVLLVAVTNQFGSASRGIPARPFMTLAAKPAVRATNPIIKKLIKPLNAGKITKKKILSAVGSEAVGVFKQTMKDLRVPPNAPATIAAKNSSNPLMDTDLMWQTLTFVVRKPNRATSK